MNIPHDASMLCDRFDSGIDNAVIVRVRFRWRELAELDDWHGCGWMLRVT